MEYDVLVSKKTNLGFSQNNAHTFITMGTCILYAQLWPMDVSIHKLKKLLVWMKKHLAFSFLY